MPMNTYKYLKLPLLLAVILYSTVINLSFAKTNANLREEKPSQVQFISNNLILLGVKYGYHLNDKFMLGVQGGHTNFDFEVDYKISTSVDYTYTDNSVNENAIADASFDTSNTFSTAMPYGEVFVSYSPFSNGFFTKIGLMYRSWKFDGLMTNNGYVLSNCRSETLGNVDCPDEEELPSEIADLPDTGEDLANIYIEWPNFATDISLGWNWIGDFGISGGIEAGAWIGSSPQISYELITEISDDNIIEDLENEIAKIQKRLDNFAILPHITLSLGYNF